MKKTRLIAAVAVAAMSASALALSASAYNAYIQLQTNQFSFRNDWTESNYGKATPYFNSWIVWGNDNLDESYEGYSEYYNFDIGDKGGYVLPATYTDATIETDGTYTVKAEGIDFGIRGDESDFNVIGVSTDLPADKGIIIKDAKVYIDGNVVKTVDEVKYDETAQYLYIGFANIWNPDLGAWGLGFPTKSLSIEFSVSGLGGGDAAAATTESKDSAPTTTAAPTTGDTQAATTSSKGSPDTGVADVAVIGGLALAAGAGIVLTRKRK